MYPSARRDAQKSLSGDAKDHQSSLTSGIRCLSLHRWISFRAFAGAGKLFMVSVSTLPGHAFVLTCTRTTSVEPMPTMSQAPSDAAARVQE